MDTTRRGFFGLVAAALSVPLVPLSLKAPALKPLPPGAIGWAMHDAGKDELVTIRMVTAFDTFDWREERL